MNFRCFVAFLSAKCVYRIMRILRRNASYFPGNIALKICPDYLGKINRVDKIICVTGTDGKTSTANLISDTLESLGYKTTGNKLGSNTNIGVATALTNALNIFGKPKVDVVVLEVDEHHVRKVFPLIKPDYLLVTNLLRDSLKRNAHPEYVFNKINQCNVKDMTVILNADEMCSSELLANNRRVFFGIDKLETDLKKSLNIINDYKICPKCGTELVYDYVRYCHIGKAHCTNCSFKSKDADCRVSNVDYGNREISVNYNDEVMNFPLINDTIFNIYNEIAVITLLLDFGISKWDLGSALSKVKITESRFSENQVENIKILKIMAKGNNSLPVSLVFDYIIKQPSNKAIILAIDDLDVKKSTELIGWIYDADYEFLNSENVKQIIVAGKRCYDHKIRLLLAGIPENKITCNMDELKAVESLNLSNIQEVYILNDMSTYKLSVNTENKIASLIRRNLEK